MARMTHETAKEFESAGAFDVFNLENDQDSDQVQFLLNSMDDVIVYTYHGITMKSRSGRDYERKVGCFRTSKDDPEGVCPFCDSGHKIKVARFIPLYSLSQKKVLLWERGPRFVDQTLKGFINRLIANGIDPKNYVVEVVRQGKKGDNQTTYALYPMERTEAHDVSKFEMPDPEGSLIATWSTEDMKKYDATGVVPDTNNDAVNSGVQRRERTAPSESYRTSPSNDTVDTTGASHVDNPEDYF